MITAAYAVGWIIAAGLVLVAVRFTVTPVAAAVAFGVPAERVGADNRFLGVKAVRDLATALMIALVLVLGRPALAGAALVAGALIPMGDTVAVLTSGVTRRAAFGIHGATAAVALAAGVVLLLA